MAIEGGQRVQAREDQSRYPEEFERRHSQTEIQFDYPSTTLSSTSVTPSHGIQQSSQITHDEPLLDQIHARMREAEAR
jgi:hypothetical protein